MQSCIPTSGNFAVFDGYIFCYLPADSFSVEILYSYVVNCNFFWSQNQYSGAVAAVCKKILFTVSIYSQIWNFHIFFSNYFNYRRSIWNQSVSVWTVITNQSFIDINCIIVNCCNISCWNIPASIIVIVGYLNLHPHFKTVRICNGKF